MQSYTRTSKLSQDSSHSTRASFARHLDLKFMFLYAKHPSYNIVLIKILIYYGLTVAILYKIIEMLLVVGVVLSSSVDAVLEISGTALVAYFNSILLSSPIVPTKQPSQVCQCVLSFVVM